MNILPHKSWHVRTKKNIARVKKDQAQAAEEEKEKQRRISLAAQEARTSYLRERAGQRFTDSKQTDKIVSQNEIISKESSSSTSVVPLPFTLSESTDLIHTDGHINFFQEIEDGKKLESSVNVDHENEKKNEKEDYEKKIGLLVYLGQNSLEHSKDKPWYEQIERPNSKDNNDKQVKVIPSISTSEKDIKTAKLKDFQDPLKDIRLYLSSPGMKKKMNTFPISSNTKKILLPTKRKVESIQNQDDDDDGAIKHKKKKSKSSNKKHRSHSRSRRSHSHKSKKHHKKHHKKSTNSNDSNDDDEEEEDEDEEESKQKILQKLRIERLEREREEKRKADKLFANLRGEVEPEMTESKSGEQHSSRFIVGDSGRKQKYNSQFNPHLARQNFDN